MANKRPPSKQQKVAILIGSLEAGGAQRMAFWLFESLTDAGLDTYLISIDRNRDMNILSSDRSSSPSLEKKIIVLSPFNVNMPTFLKFLVAPYQWVRLQVLLSRKNVNCLISFMERANILNLCSLGRHKKILSVRSHPDLLVSKDALKQKAIKLIYTTLLSRSFAVIFNANEAKEAFVERFPIKNSSCRTIYNYCREDILLKLAEETIPQPYLPLFDSPVILAIGRLKIEKGFIQLIRAFNVVSQQNREARLVILGEGPLHQELEEYIQQLNLTGRVLLPGYYDNPMAWIKKSHLFVLPSIWEGFPNALLEALTLGAAVIATDCSSGPREILSPQSKPSEKTDQLEITPFGVLCPPLPFSSSTTNASLTEQEKHLADAMIRLLDDDALRNRLKKNAKSRSKDFTPEKILPQWLEII